MAAFSGISLSGPLLRTGIFGNTDISTLGNHHRHSDVMGGSTWAVRMSSGVVSCGGSSVLDGSAVGHGILSAARQARSLKRNAINPVCCRILDSLRFRFQALGVLISDMVLSCGCLS